MPSQFDRTEMLIGKEGVKVLQNAKVAIFGIGGVRLFCSRSIGESWHSGILY